MRTFANVGIVPIENLEHTANILGSVLDLEFTRDLDGEFEEFPAYAAEKNGLRYALLGIPEQKYDLREEKTNY